MTHVPHDLIVRQIEDAVQGQGQFDHAQVRCEMAAVDRADAHERVANLTGEQVDIRSREVMNVGVRADSLEDHSISFDGRAPQTIP